MQPSAVTAGATVACPSCHATMAQDTFSDRVGRPVVIDTCHSCRLFWFDTQESVALTPASTLALFRMIADAPRQGFPVAASDARCPRCRRGLTLTRDLQRTTRFEYLACPERHGRLISFLNFLREKDFVRPLNDQQIAQLRASVQTVNCANCGAPVALERGAECGHCRSPLTMFDMKHAGALVERLRREAEGAAAAQPAKGALLALELERIRAAARATRYSDDETGWRGLGADDLVTAGLKALAKWFTG